MRSSWPRSAAFRAFTQSPGLIPLGRQLEVELRSVNEQIASLRRLSATLQADRSTLERKVQARRHAAAPSVAATPKPKPTLAAINYATSKFSWSGQIKKMAKDIWGITSFRLCQEAAINASLDGREVVAILPTGGGKSLVYQIPAIISEGTTIVVTPLISLMNDQVYNLKGKGVSAEMIHAATTQDEVRDILRRMIGATKPVKGKGKAKVEDESEGEKVKMVYVTPERLDKSKVGCSSDHE